MICYGCIHCDCDLTGDEDDHWSCTDCDDFADGNPSDPRGLTPNLRSQPVPDDAKEAL